MTTKQAVLVIYESVNGRDNWIPRMPAELPEWVRHPDIIGRLVAGQMCMDPTIGDKGSNWYRAERVLTPEERRAEARRLNRQQKRLAAKAISGLMPGLIVPGDRNRLMH
ncbi:MAG: hypothetical protein WC073_11330 [Sterolibacterium sp.]